MGGYFKPLTITDAIKYAEEHNGVCLSKKYKNARSIIKWKCKNGHVWKTRWKNMYDGRWCKKCKNNERKLTIEDAKLIAKKRGGVCLSKEYKSYDTKLKWRCKFGHEWMANISAVKFGTWCRECVLGKTRLSLSDCIAAANNFGGICLSQEYKNATTIMTWRCSNAHEWKAPARRIIHEKKWCPKCSRKSQNLLALTIERIFPDCNIEQEYTRFDWLKTKTGRQKIDIFVSELKLAIEYDGQGHFTPVNFGGCDNKTALKIFNKTKHLDRLKNKKIKKHAKDVQYFVRFSYLEPIFDEKYVIEKLKLYNVPIGVNND